MRSTVTLAILLVSAGRPAALRGAGGASCEASVVYRSGSSASDDALAGIRETLAASACHVQYLDLGRAETQRGWPAALAAAKLVVAVGIGAWEQVASAKIGASLLAALVLPADMRPGDPHRVGAVYADVPLKTTIEILRDLFPKSTRVALIHRAGWPTPDPGAAAYARQFGMELRIAECPGPEKLLSVFTSLQGQTDLVITEPDAVLYNSATIQPLVLASIDRRLPLIGFSAGFVRAGALTGVYPDFHELGRRTGELAADLLDGKPGRSDESARKVTIAVNPRLERLLGIAVARRPGVAVLE